MLLQSFIITLCLRSTNISINTTTTTTQATILQRSTTPDSSRKIVERTSTGAPRKIVGGQQCSVENYPFIISLRRLKSLRHFCTGTLIRPSWVLTAGHCIAQHVTQPRLFTAIAGISQLNRLGIQRIRVGQIFVHPDFDENNYDNDISLISLAHSFVLTELVKPISIPTQVIHEDLHSVCPKGVTIGWGWHKETKVEHQESGFIPHFPVMQCVVNLSVLSDQQCRNARAGMHLRPNTFCAMTETTENICQGDSGGPFFCNGVQFGIVSSGFTCNFPDDTPGYYTRIDRVLNFIKECMSGEVNYFRNVDREAEDESIDIKQNISKYLLSTMLYLNFLNILL